MLKFVLNRKKFRKIFLLLPLLSGFFFSHAQCPVQLFSVQDTTCPLKDIEVINNDNSGSNYQWDFCTGDLHLTPSKSNLVMPSGLCLSPEQMKIVRDGDKYFGFIQQAYSKVLKSRFKLANI